MKKMDRVIRSKWAAEALFLFCMFCFYLMWARIQPLGAGPDEPMRYNIPRYIYEHGRLPVGDDPAVRDITWGISYAYSPYLSYIVAALFMKIVSFATTKPFALLMAARLVSALCGVGTAFFALRIGKRLFEPYKAWIFTVFIALLPGSVFVFTYVNNDSAALFSTAVIVYAWVRGMQDGWEYKTCVILALGIAVCALSYYNAYGFILCSIVLFGSGLLIFCREQGDYRPFLRKGLLVSLLVLALISWWFIRNFILYDGDFLGWHASSLCAEKYAAEGFKPSNMYTPRGAGISMFRMLFYGCDTPPTSSWISVTARSFIGRFGQFSVCLPAGMEYAYICYIIEGLLLTLLHPVRMFAVRVRGKWSLEGIFHWGMLAAMIIPNVLNAWYSYTSGYQPQGRYSLPMLIPLAFFLTKGYGDLFDSMIADARVRRAVCAGLCFVLIGVGIWVYAAVLWPEYMEVPFGIGALVSGA